MILDPRLHAISRVTDHHQDPVRVYQIDPTAHICSFPSSPWRIVAGSPEGAVIRMAFVVSFDGAMGTGPGDMVIHSKCSKTP
jgi:hypothetical protein